MGNVNKDALIEEISKMNRDEAVALAMDLLKQIDELKQEIGKLKFINSILSGVLKERGGIDDIADAY